MKQKTINKGLRFSGPGIHSGKNSRALLLPAPENSGIYFVKSGKRVPALASQVKETARGTTLGEIAVVEHLLAALYALGVDNLEVQIDGSELPALDGSARPYVEEILKTGLREQRAEARPRLIESPIRIGDAKAWIEASPFFGFKIDFMVDFPVAGRQRLDFDVFEDDFRSQIAPARTFGYIEEFEILKQQGLALGATLENSLVISRDGYLNAPRYKDELVRHKILDLIGDLSLIGRPLRAKITACKSGHRLNLKLARRIIENDRT